MAFTESQTWTGTRTLIPGLEQPGSSSPFSIIYIQISSQSSADPPTRALLPRSSLFSLLSLLLGASRAAYCRATLCAQVVNRGMNYQPNATGFCPERLLVYRDGVIARAVAGRLTPSVGVACLCTECASALASVRIVSYTSADRPKVSYTSADRSKPWVDRMASPEPARRSLTSYSYYSQTQQH